LEYDFYAARQKLKLTSLGGFASRSLAHCANIALHSYESITSRIVLSLSSKDDAGGFSPFLLVHTGQGYSEKVCAQ